MSTTGPGHMNNKARARYFARVIAVLTERLNPEDRDVKITLGELKNCPDIGFDFDDENQTLIIALGDPIK